MTNNLADGIDPKVMKTILEKHAEAVRNLPPPVRLTDKLIDVQPLPPPIGLIFYYRMRYGNRPSTCPDKL